jgi:hypothetical protein
VRRRTKKATTAVAALPMIIETIKTATIVKIRDLLSGVGYPPPIAT